MIRMNENEAKRGHKIWRPKLFVGIHTQYFLALDQPASQPLIFPRFQTMRFFFKTVIALLLPVEAFAKLGKTVSETGVALDTNNKRE